MGVSGEHGGEGGTVGGVVCGVQVSGDVVVGDVWAVLLDVFVAVVSFFAALFIFP